MNPSSDRNRMAGRGALVAVVVAALVGAGVSGLLVNIFERKQEARKPYVQVVEITDETEDPAVWGKNFPQQYDAYRRTVDQVRTRYGGSEAVPRTPTAADPRSVVAQSPLEEDPRLKTVWAGPAFPKDVPQGRGPAHTPRAPVHAGAWAHPMLKAPQGGKPLRDQVLVRRKGVVRQRFPVREDGAAQVGREERDLVHQPLRVGRVGGDQRGDLPRSLAGQRELRKQQRVGRAQRAGHGVAFAKGDGRERERRQHGRRKNGKAPGGGLRPGVI